MWYSPSAGLFLVPLQQVVPGAFTALRLEEGGVVFFWPATLVLALQAAFHDHTQHDIKSMCTGKHTRVHCGEFRGPKERSFLTTPQKQFGWRFAWTIVVQDTAQQPLGFCYVGRHAAGLVQRIITCCGPSMGRPRLRFRVRIGWIGWIKSRGRWCWSPTCLLVFHSMGGRRTSGVGAFQGMSKRPHGTLATAT